MVCTQIYIDIYILEVYEFVRALGFVGLVLNPYWYCNPFGGDMLPCIGVGLILQRKKMVKDRDRIECVKSNVKRPSIAGCTAVVDQGYALRGVLLTAVGRFIPATRSLSDE